MGTCGQPGYVFRDFCLKQGIEFIIFCLDQGIDLSIFVLNRMSFKTKLIARLVLQQKGKIYWPIFQLAELVFFRAST